MICRNANAIVEFNLYHPDWLHHPLTTLSEDERVRIPFAN